MEFAKFFETLFSGQGSNYSANMQFPQQMPRQTQNVRSMPPVRVEKKMNPFMECLRDRQLHPNDEYHFEVAGIKCMIKSTFRFNWDGCVFLPSEMEDTRYSLAELKRTYKVVNGLDFCTRNCIGFTTSTYNDYCLLRETMTQKSETNLPYRSFEFVRAQTESLAFQVAERLALQVAERQNMYDCYEDNSQDLLSSMMNNIFDLYEMSQSSQPSQPSQQRMPMYSEQRMPVPMDQRMPVYQDQRRSTPMENTMPQYFQRQSQPYSQQRSAPSVIPQRVPSVIPQRVPATKPVAETCPFEMLFGINMTTPTGGNKTTMPTAKPVTGTCPFEMLFSNAMNEIPKHNMPLRGQGNMPMPSARPPVTPERPPVTPQKPSQSNFSEENFLQSIMDALKSVGFDDIKVIDDLMTTETNGSTNNNHKKMMSEVLDELQNSKYFQRNSMDVDEYDDMPCLEDDSECDESDSSSSPSESDSSSNSETETETGTDSETDSENSDMSSSKKEELGLEGELLGLLSLEFMYPGAIGNLLSLKSGDKICICGQCNKDDKYDNTPTCDVNACSEQVANTFPAMEEIKNTFDQVLQELLKANGESAQCSEKKKVD